MSQLLAPFRDLTPHEFVSTWRSPSNIAFVKYWGKKGHQIPANPSFSMTLQQCTSTTKTVFRPHSGLNVTLKLEGNDEPRFALKIRDYLETLQTELPWITNLAVAIETSNTFPHGTGIASSASGLSAFALTLADFLHHEQSKRDENLFYKRASYLSRLASGSACRSIYGGFAHWGKSELENSSDEFALPFSVHPELAQLEDTIVVIDSKEKNVSSRSGHSKMTEHGFAESRYKVAKKNFTSCLEAMQKGDMEQLGLILEAEALSLHAMMLTSPEPYSLLRPKTLAAMEAIWDFRRESKLPLYFTLDAGPNLHLIYPPSYQPKIKTFINHELAPLAEKIIDDRTGEGPKKC